MIINLQSIFNIFEHNLVTSELWLNSKKTKLMSFSLDKQIKQTSWNWDKSFFYTIKSCLLEQEAFFKSTCKYCFLIFYSSLIIVLPGCFSVSFRCWIHWHHLIYKDLQRSSHDLFLLTVPRVCTDFGKIT